jgi:hypothetical protein
MKPLRKTLFEIVLCVGVIAAATPAMATDRGTAAQRAACTPDVLRLCAFEIPDVDRIVACLKREKASLSAACRVVMVGGEHTVAESR